MSGSAPNVINRAETSQSSQFHSPDVSAFLPHTPTAVTNHFVDFQFTPANNTTSNFGGHTRIEQVRHSHKSWKQWLFFQIGQLSSSGAPTVMRYVDWLGYAAPQRILVKFDNNKMIDLRSLDFVVWIKLTMCQERRDNIAFLAKGDLTPAERTTLSQGSGTIQLRVPLFWLPWNDPRHAFENAAFGRKLIYEIDWATLGDLVELSGAALSTVSTAGTTDISDIKLATDWVELTEGEKNSLIKRVNTKGISHKITDIERHEREPIPSGATNYKLEITNVQTPGTTLMLIIIRPQTALDPGAATTDPFGSFTSIDRYQLLHNGKNIFTEKISHDRALYILNDDFEGVENGLLVYPLKFAIEPKDHYNQSGHLPTRDFDRIDIEIEKDAGFTGAHFMDVVILGHNVWTSFKGNANKAVNG